MSFPTLRVARPTDSIEVLKSFYVDRLGLKMLYKFSDHDGFDGLMVGVPECPYHSEFTKKYGHSVGSAPTTDNLLVFYLPDVVEWEQAIQPILGSFRTNI